MNTTETRKRPYRLKERALQQAETRQRIVDATVKLHTSVGPAHTTIKAIAEAAGVERLTVYRHFPNADSLYGACTARGRELWPPPRIANWAGIADPEVRLRTALLEIYDYYDRRGDGLAVIFRDIEAWPAWLRDSQRQQRQAMVNSLMRGRPARARRLLRAVLAHALDFHTYRSLVKEQQLKIQDAVQLMIQLVRVGGSLARLNRTRRRANVGAFVDAGAKSTSTRKIWLENS